MLARASQRQVGTGKGPPDNTMRFKCTSKLAAALATKTANGKHEMCTFTQSEWDALGPYDEELLASHCVGPIGQRFYGPAVA